MFKIISVFLLFICISCTSRIGDFTALSTRNSNIKNWKRATERTEGKSCVFWVLIIPIGDRDIKDSVENAIDSHNDKINGRDKSFFSIFSEKKSSEDSSKKADIVYESLLDVKFSIHWWTVLLFSRSCLIAEGTPSDSWYQTIEREEQIKK